MTDEPRAIPRTYDYGSYFLGPIEVEPIAAAAPAAAVARPSPAGSEIPPAEPAAASSPRPRIDTSYSYFSAPDSPQSSARIVREIVSAGRSDPLTRSTQSNARNGSPTR